MIKHKAQVCKAQYFKVKHISYICTINTPHHQLIQVKKHDLQVLKTPIKALRTINFCTTKHIN